MRTNYPARNFHFVMIFINKHSKWTWFRFSLHWYTISFSPFSVSYQETENIPQPFPLSLRNLKAYKSVRTRGKKWCPGAKQKYPSGAVVLQVPTKYYWYCGEVLLISPRSTTAPEEHFYCSENGTVRSAVVMSAMRRFPLAPKALFKYRRTKIWR